MHSLCPTQIVSTGSNVCSVTAYPKGVRVHLLIFLTICYKSVVLNLWYVYHWWYLSPPLVVLRGVSRLYFNIMVVLGETDIF